MTQYFIDTVTGALLRREGGTDTAFYGGDWHPTETILEYMIGDENDVEPVTETQARKSYPDAFRG